MIRTAAKLRERITVQKPVDTPDASGYDTDQWADVARVWAAVKDINAREYVASAAALTQSRVTFTIRWRDDVDATMRVLFRGRRYAIEDIGHGDYRRQFLDLRTHSLDVLPAGGE